MAERKNDREKYHGQTGRLAGWLAGRQAGRQAGSRTDGRAQRRDHTILTE